MPGHVYWLDSNNVYQGCNDSQAKAFGLNSRQEIVGKRNQDLPNIDLATAAKWDKNNLEILREGLPRILQEPSILEDGKLATVLSHKIPLRDEKDNTIGLLGISLDITEFKRQQDELESRIEQTDLPLEHILAHMPGHVYWKNREGVYLGCNDSQAKTLGMSSGKDVVGKTDLNLPWGEELAKVYRENDLRIIRTGVSETVEEVASIHGKKVVYLSFKTSLRNKQGETVGVLGISIDISKQKEAEEKLIKAKELAEAADKAKTEFLENMRHDIRTPLSGIIGLSEALNHEENKSQIKKYASSLAAASKELLRFLNEILDSIHVASGQIPLLKKKFNLREILEDLVKLHRPKALEKQLGLTLTVDNSVPKYLLGDPVRIYRILLELLVNALKFTQEGHIRILATVGKKEGKTITLQIFVEDTGLGIPDEKQQELFIRFKRLTPSYEGVYQGHGLGLSMVRQFIDDLQGEIYVDSHLNIGSKFVCVIPLDLPLLDEPFKVNTTQNATVVYDGSNSVKESADQKFDLGTDKRCLVVEDQPIASLAVKALLEQQGCVVNIAETGEMAIKLAQQYEYDFIIVDIGLPDLNGYEVTKIIRQLKAGKEQPLIIGLTGHAEGEKKQLAIAVGMDFFFNKPLTQEATTIILKKLSLAKEVAERHKISTISNTPEGEA